MVQEVRGLRLGMMKRADSKPGWLQGIRKTGRTGRSHTFISPSRKKLMEEAGKAHLWQPASNVGKNSTKEATLHRRSSQETVLPPPPCLLFSTFCSSQMFCYERCSGLPAAANPAELFSSYQGSVCCIFTFDAFQGIPFLPALVLSLWYQCGLLMLLCMHHTDGILNI